MDALFSDYEDVKKSGLFDAEYYLRTYPDVAQRNVDPLVHYLEEGAQAGRDPHPDFDSAFYLKQSRLRGEEPNNPLLHYIRIGAARGFKTRRDKADREVPAQRPSPAMDRVAKLPILVAIEALGVVGAADGTSRLSISGWALATAPIVEITVSVGSGFGGTACYGWARPDVARLYPDRAGAADCGFVLACGLPSLTSGTIEPLLTVRTAAGEIGENSLRIEIPPQQMPPGIPDAAAMELHIEEAVVDPGGVLRIEGWVVSFVQIEAVEAFIEEECIGTAEFGRARADVGNTHATYPNSRFSGFRLVSDVGEQGCGSKIITIRARARAGVSREATAHVEVPDRATLGKAMPVSGFQCHCDEITLTPNGRIALRGWAVCPSPVETVVVLLDGEEVGKAEPGLERPDIGNLFPVLAHARRSGFACNARTRNSLDGEHLITVRVCREDGQIHEARIPVRAGEEGQARSATAEDPDLKLHIDTPLPIGGWVDTPIRGSLEISGWALARAGVAAIEILVDHSPLALAEHGLRRLDVKAAFPDWPGALGSGFQALIPHRLLPKGRRTLTVTLRDNAARTARVEFGIEVDEPSKTEGPWSLRRTLGQAEIDLGLRLLERNGRHPLFLVMLPVNDEEASLDKAGATIASLCAQAYPNWRLLIVPQRRAARPAVVRDRLLTANAGLNERAEVVRDLTAGVLAGMAAGEGTSANEMFLAMLAPGDELGCDAFLELAIASALHREADFLYSDERCRNPATGTIEAFFKPQWSPDLMLSSYYVGRLWCARADLVRSVADPNEMLLAHGEYDLALRCTEAAEAIRHVPAVLCERTADDPEQSAEQSRGALERLLVRRGIDGDIRKGRVPGTYRLRRVLAKPGLVSIIIPTCAAEGMIRNCIESLRRVTAYRNYEIICIENIPPEDRKKWRGWLRRNADRTISAKAAFNWSRFNNLAAKEAKGEYLLFLNDDIEIVDPEWLDALLEEAQRPEVGVVGARLLYPDRRVQHAGMFLVALGQVRHAFRYAPEDDPGYFGLALTRRNVIAVTGACLMTRRETFDALGGFDESQAIINNDLDYCLQAWRKGLLNVYTPHATLVHHEAISRAALPDDYDVAVFEGKWRELFLAGDPFFNPHLSRDRDEFAVDLEPTRLVVTGRPVFRRDEIRTILVVKLDHIGDCVISFPAVRRLKRHFPNARITVLTSRSSRPVWSFEPEVETTIEFDFFHVRSAEGQVDISEDDWRELSDRLMRTPFDLAVDLRKHPETRPVLQHTGARYLAGFDYRNQFPWLDIALEWTGDQIYARKRQHTADDLINLVDAIAAACDADRAIIAGGIAAGSPGQPASAGGEHPIVWVHPTAGNEIKQWPLEYFAVVIDRLIEMHGARIFLTGAPGDEAVAAGIVERLRHPTAVTSLIGKSPLGQLPVLMRGASLFLGNDSGLKHIAAGLGIPTVGVHGGTLDVREWGPVGPNALAVVRDVVCSPCYLSKVEDCRRDVACLRQLEPARVYEACRRLLPTDAPAQPASLPGDTKPGAARRPLAAKRRAETGAQEGRA